MSTPFQKAFDTFPIKSQLIVCGFTRRASQLFETDNPYYNIPFAINHICLIFYYQCIAFDKNKCGPGLILSGLEQNIVTYNASDDVKTPSTVYHFHWYHSQWKGCVSFNIKIEKLNGKYSNHGLFLGFSTSDDFIDDGFYRNKEEFSYAMQCNGILWVKYKRNHTSVVQENARSLAEGDEIKFTLNLTESKIYISMNNEPSNVLFQDIITGTDIQYKFAVAFYSGSAVFGLSKSGDSVSIRQIDDFTFDPQ